MYILKRNVIYLRKYVFLPIRLEGKKFFAEIKSSNSQESKNKHNAEDFMKRIIAKKETLGLNIKPHTNQEIEEFKDLIFTDPEKGIEVLSERLNNVSDAITFSNWLQNLFTFLEYISFSNKREEMVPLYSKLIKNLSTRINSLSHLDSVLITFISKTLPKLEFKDPQYLFYFFYTMIKGIFPRKKEFENIMSFRLDEYQTCNNFNDFLISVRDCEVNNLSETLLKTFTKLFKDFSQMEVSKILEISIIFRYYYPELCKSTYNEELSLLYMNFDMILGHHLEQNMNSEFYDIITFSMIRFKAPSYNYPILPNIFSALCKKCNLTNVMSKPEYTFLHTKFLKEYFKESRINKHIASLFNSNLFYIADLYRDKEKLKKVDDGLLVHLLYFFTNNKYEVEKEFFEEVSRRLPDFLKEFDIVKIQALVNSLSMIHPINTSFLRSVMSHPNLTKLNPKHYLNIGYYFSLAKIDDEKLWLKYFKGLEPKFKQFNHMDIKMVKSLRANLSLFGNKYEKMIVSNIGKDKEEKSDFMRYFYSKDLGSYSTADVTILKYLKQYNLNFKSQVHIDNHLVDFVLGDKVILEMNGPHHYMLNNPLKLDPKSEFTKQVLESRGYYAIEINITQKTHSLYDYDITFREIIKTVKNSVPIEEYERIFQNNEEIKKFEAGNSY